MLCESTTVVIQRPVHAGFAGLARHEALRSGAAGMMHFTLPPVAYPSRRGVPFRIWAGKASPDSFPAGLAGFGPDWTGPHQCASAAMLANNRLFYNSEKQAHFELPRRKRRLNPAPEAFGKHRGHKHVE
ncbi:MAG: hypothetical protein OXF56_11585, partial [Rhodobacteraceae bacterium]|nr:hypothetical protein [Paracoccaceae bacterium]